MIIKIKDRWLIINKKNDLWFNSLKDFPESTYLNDIEWANHLEKFGWKTLRLIKIKNNPQNSKTLIQAFIKFLPLSTAIIWIPGGIIGDLSNIMGLQEEIKKILNVRFCIIRIRFPQLYSCRNEIELMKYKWQRAWIPFTSRFKVLLKLDNSIKLTRKKYSRSWCRSLKKSSNFKLKIVPIKNYEIIAKLYKDMKLNKRLKKNDIYSENECKSIFYSFKKKLLIFGAKDELNNICSIRGVIIRDGVLHDIFAASNKLGRLYSASHLILDALIEKGTIKGFTEYDLSYVDPENSFGVYNFKKGSGGTVINTLGEFEWTNSIFLRILINLYSKFK
tara:strand:- start:9 stop:1007 length:999 start_codon:yes stop_codon:yes gene_type:complete